MSSTMFAERKTNGMTCGTMTSTPAMNIGQMCMVPRCEMRVETCNGGMKIICRCEDENTCRMMQNLCQMLEGGLCTCTCTTGGITICQYNLTCGACKCEYTADGITITCTSGDKTCCQMIQACCECLGCLIDSGCCCQISINNTAVCIGCGTC